MLGILIDAGVLMILLKTINDDDVGFGAALVASLATSISAVLLALALVPTMGMAGVFLAAAIAAVLLAVILGFFFGVELKRAMIISGLFIVLHVVVSLVLAGMLNAARA